ncbi:MAG TPA: ribosome small subunit-dependent GTPase A [Acidimicrobiales bacterium]
MTHPLAHLGWQPRVEALVDACRPDHLEAADVVVGRVVRADKGHARIGTAAGELLVTVTPDMTPAGPPVVGDWVVVADDPDAEGGSTIAGVADRWSQLQRHDPEGIHRSQVLVANVDVVALVHGMDRPLSPGRIERMLSAVWEAGAEPLIIVTKTDLSSDGDIGAVVHVLAEVALGVDVVVTSAVDGSGVADVAAHVTPDRTLLLLGESGGGKSSLLNVLVGADAMAVGEVREGDSKGRHTTTHRQLVPLPAGGVLVDTPGVRAFALWDAADGIGATFAEIAAAAESCRFRDCNHDAEPGCAVKAAVASGEIDADRFDRYLALRAEQDTFELRADEVARRARG